MIYDMFEELSGVFTVQHQYDTMINDPDLSNTRASAEVTRLQNETGHCWAAQAVGQSPNPESGPVSLADALAAASLSITIEGTFTASDPNGVYFRHVGNASSVQLNGVFSPSELASIMSWLNG